MLVPWSLKAHPIENPPASTCDTLGINVEPGSADDGWASPPPVQLHDGSHLQLYKDGEALRAAYDAIAQAKRLVCLEVYIFAGDETGRAFIDLLVDKAKAGVKVFLLYDSFGCLETDRSLFRRLQKAGGRVMEFHPLRFWECRFGWRPLNRDHRKLLVVDDNIAGMGGLNIANEYAGPWIVKDNAAAGHFWRDTAVGIVGPSARPLLQAFSASWNYTLHGGPIARAETVYGLPDLPRLKRRAARKVRPTRLLKYQEGDDNPPPLRLRDDIGLLASAPTTTSPLRPLMQQLIRNATQSIDMTMAYFAPDDKLVTELCRAARRGVRVRLMLPGCCDIAVLRIAAESFYDLLLSSGVKVFERQTAVLHAKTISVDERISIIGSTNMDYRSVNFNCELSLAIRSRTFGRQMTAMFENDLTFAKPVEETDWHKRPVIDRLVQWGVSRARYLL